MQLEDVLANNDLRVTQPRRVVWQVLSASDAHLTAQEIAAEVKTVDETINVSSVYRTLALFAQLSLARETTFGEDGSRWEPAHSDEVIHLVCEDCDTVTHHSGTAVSRLREHLAANHDFLASDVNVVVKGTCSNCAK